jgi:hypothetical protein
MQLLKRERTNPHKVAETTYACNCPSNMDPRFQTQVIRMIISVTTIWKNKKTSYKQLKPMCDLNYNCCMTWVLQFLKQLCNLAKQLLLQENVIFLTQKGTFYCVDIFKPFKKIINLLQQKVSLFGKWFHGTLSEFIDHIEQELTRKQWIHWSSKQELMNYTHIL